MATCAKGRGRIGQVSSRAGLQWALAAAALSLGAPLGAEPVTITREQVATTPPEQMHRMLRDLLWDTIEVRDIRGADKRDISPIRVDTKVQPGLVPGLCRYDSLFLMLRPSAGDPGKHQVRNLVVRPHFRFLTPPTKIYASTWFTGATNPECEAITDKTGFFEAGDEQVATDAYRAYVLLHQALRAGDKLPVSCGVLRKADCTPAHILAIRPEDLDSVGECEEPDLFCHRVASSRHERTVEIVMQPGNDQIRLARLDFLPISVPASDGAMER